MKGVEEIKSFLKSGKDFSASKDALPHPQVDREALIKVLMELHIENLALKANRPKVNGESPSVILAAGFTGESVAVGTPMNAAANSFVPSAGGDESQANLPKVTPGESSSATMALTGKPESEKLCRVMWGKYPCPGEGCTRVHLKWCASPKCLISEETSKQCKLWHGHLRVALQREKAKKKKEAVQRAAEAEQREFKEWKKQRNPAPGNSAKTKGHKGDPKGRLQKPTQQNGRNGQPGQQRGWKQPGHHQRAQSRGKWEQPRPGPRILGDYFPNLPRPARPGSVWGNPPPNTAWAPTTAAPTSAQELLLSLKALLNSGVV